MCIRDSIKDNRINTVCASMLRPRLDFVFDFIISFSFLLLLLDVYKRQKYFSVFHPDLLPQNDTPDSFRPNSHVRIGHILFSFPDHLKPHTPLSVSYTHLDVYKRQACNDFCVNLLIFILTPPFDIRVYLFSLFYQKYNTCC